jgi:hypothetical protein
LTGFAESYNNSNQRINMTFIKTSVKIPESPPGMFVITRTRNCS